MKQTNRDGGSLLEIRNAFTGMLLNANTRGGHATGFAQIDKFGDYAITKFPVDAYRFFDEGAVKMALNLIDSDVTTLMGHTRYSTKGSPAYSRNNHPIRAGNTIGTHNGSISNDDELFHKYGMERFAEVDSEVIFRLHETAKNVDDFMENRIPKLRGQMSIVFADVEFPDYVYMVKGNNPLEVAYNRKLNVIVYGSTRDIVLGGFDESDLEWIDIKSNTMMRVDTRSMKRIAQSVNFSGYKTRPFRFDDYHYDDKIGAYRKTKENALTNETVLGFVPRYSYSDSIKMNKKKKHTPVQMDAFKESVCNDGSTIKKIKEVK